MENNSLLNLIKVLSGLGCESSGNATAKNTAERTDKTTSESNFNSENKQTPHTGTLETSNNDSAEKFNYTYSVLERHEKMSNRIKNKRS